MNQNIKAKVSLSFLLLLSFSFLAQANYFPETENWEISSPEEQGVDSDKIKTFIEYLNKRYNVRASGYKVDICDVP